MKVLRRVSIGAVVFLGYARWYNKHFFPRDPSRVINQRARAVSPTDGRVIYIEAVADGEVPISVKNRRPLPLAEVVKGDERPPAGVLIGVYLSPYDVHYQRVPLSGKVTEISYHPAPANHLMTSMFIRNYLRIQPMYSESPHIYANERNVVCVEGDDLSAYVVQIADKVVNKIDCYLEEGQPVDKGEKLGMIRQGSQVDLYLPGITLEDLSPSLKVGQKLTAGESPIIEG